jgi:hypothetical protein
MIVASYHAISTNKQIVTILGFSKIAPGLSYIVPADKLNYTKIIYIFFFIEGC